MPAVPFGIPVAPGTLLGLLADEVATCTGLPPAYVLESLCTDDDHLKMPPADRFATVSGFDYPVDAGVTGGGRYLTGFASTARVALFSRVGTDKDLRSRALLRDAGRGLLTLVLRLLGESPTGLQMWAPIVTPGFPHTGCYLREPARLSPRGWRVLPKPARGGQVWAAAETFWELKFTADLTVDPLPG